MMGAHFINSNWKFGHIEPLEKMLVKSYQFQMCLIWAAMKVCRDPTTKTASEQTSL